MSGIDWHERLRERGALLEGHFRLSSGLHSPHYVQCALLLQHPADAEAAGRALVERLRDRVATAPTAVVSPAIGGLVLGHEVARAWGCRAIWAERGKDGALGLRRGFAIDPGEPIVAVEDVVTTAGSLRELVALAESRGGRIVGIGVLVDRSGGAVAWDRPAAALVELDGIQHRPEECPACAAGEPIEKPGSRPDSERGRRGA